MEEEVEKFLYDTQNKRKANMIYFFCEIKILISICIFFICIKVFEFNTFFCGAVLIIYCYMKLKSTNFSFDYKINLHNNHLFSLISKIQKKSYIQDNYFSIKKLESIIFFESFTKKNKKKELK
ncbi:hypothetical protein [Campylobacter canadensis]|uniref:hypothetical protein n=1 Tax=Campylobacter canadensis TaxID=449520 RepID=UPI001CCB4223|nr:hypothetical protein [Campylobacter canadensis]MBZ8002391.1 hypothetical protein [Campylobacter canadensis]